MKAKLAVGGRFWEEKEGLLPVRAIEYVQRTLVYADRVFLAINVDKDKSNALQTISVLRDSRLEAFGVSPWQKFVPALNAMVHKANCAGMDFILFQSIEVVITPEGVRRLLSQMDEKTICVGAKLEGHEFRPGEVVKGDGLSIPWNACCAWSLERLARWGFPLGADNPSTAGMEDGAAMAFLQGWYPSTTIKLVEVDGIKWQVDFDDRLDRREYQKRKMESKKERMASHLKHLGVLSPKIMHIAS